MSQAAGSSNYHVLPEGDFPIIRREVEERFNALGISRADVMSAYQTATRVTRTDNSAKGRDRARWEVRNNGLLLYCRWNKDLKRVYVHSVVIDDGRDNDTAEV